ncbi:PASTA domain-containing protein [Aquimarina sp. 2201CG1-2-11]|uniref:PASTA domain-containing protein n=1 Tax=Aquimarina discodermiae TaxID=3231043 RepID=UPI003461AE74
MKQIHFKGSIRNLQNQLINLEGIAIDFFDSTKNKWLPIIKEITVTKGEIEVIYNISKRRTVDKKIIEVIEKGPFPSFRLSWNKKQKLTKVFCVGGAVEINSENEATVYFGELYLVEIPGKQKSTSGIDFQQVAIPKLAAYDVFFKELISKTNTSERALNVRPIEDDSTDNFERRSTSSIGAILPGGGIGVPVDDIGDGSGGGGGNITTINALNKIIDDLRKQLNTKDLEIGRLKQDNITLNNQNDALVTERNNLVTQGTHLRNEKIKLEADVKRLYEEIARVDKVIAKLNGEISSKDSHINNLNIEINSLKTQIASKDVHIDNLDIEIDNLNTQIASKDIHIDNLDKEILDLKNEIKTLGTENNDLEQKTANLSQEKNTLIIEKGVLESELTIKEQEIVVLTTEKNELELEIEQLNISHPGESKAFKINDIYRQLVEDVNLASLELKDVGNYQLGNVTIDLKTHIQNDDKGLKVQTLDKDSAKAINEGAVSNVKINIESTKAIQNVEKVSVPDFSGLTEKAVKKKALQFNVKITPIYQYNQTERIGSAFMQLPKPGVRVLPLTKVKVFFAKN